MNRRGILAPKGSFGHTLLKARWARKMSQGDVSVALRQAVDTEIENGVISGSRVSDWEREVQEVPEEVLPTLCEILCIPVPEQKSKRKAVTTITQYVHVFVPQPACPHSTYADVR